MMIKTKSKLITVLLTLVLCGCSAGEPDLQAGEEGFSCTMKEAWAIAEKEVRKEWADDAEAILITSTDNHDAEQPSNGTDGKRNCWNFMFYSQKKEKEYSAYVINGNVMYGQEVATPHDGTFSMEDVKMDSDDMYKIAVENQMKGGEDWAWGFHYGLQYRYGDSEEEPISTISVRGLNEKGNEQYILVDTDTGEIIASTEKVGYDEDGRAIWKGETPELEDTFRKAPNELTREWVEKEYDIFDKCVKYNMDPAELTDRIIEQYYSDYFSPYSDIASYEEDEWRRRMEAYYGEDWEERLAEYQRQ